MEINWAIVIICVSLWFAGYFFGYSVGKSAGIKEGSFGVLDRMYGNIRTQDVASMYPLSIIAEDIEKLPKRKEEFDYEHKKGN